MHGEALAAHGGAAGEQAGLPLALVLLQQLEHALVVQVGVVVVHQLGVAAVVVGHVGGDALAEVGLKAVHALVQKGPQLVLIPFPGAGVGKVHHRQAGLPQVPLPHVAVGALQQVAQLHGLPEEGDF